MTDPLALLPLAAASRGGAIDDIPAAALVSAGLTLLQRSAPLVRALAGKRAGILLPTSPAFLVALAASEGRGAVLINPRAPLRDVAGQIADSEVGAVFTIGALADRLPAEVTRVLLDDAPRRAVVAAGGVNRPVDLGSHFAFDIAGDPEAPGDPGEAVIVYTSAMRGHARGAILTHRNILANARAVVGAAAVTGDDVLLAALPFSRLFGLVVSGIGPLLGGARITTMPRFHPARAVDLLDSGRVTMFAGVPAMYRAMLAVLRGRQRLLAGGKLRLAACGGAAAGDELQSAWFEATGVELRQGYGLAEASPVALFNAVDLPNVRGTLGRPVKGVEVSIRDDATFTSQPDGVAGEICIRGETVFAGYVQRSGTAVPPGLEVRDGWLRTGELGVQLEDGTVRLAGRSQAMLTRDGVSV